jgi:hypothetical protein
MNKAPKNADKYKCVLCDFKCSKQCEWTRHLSTSKHQNRAFSNNLEQNVSPLAINKGFTCKHCEKIYVARNSLWYHEKKCIKNKETDQNLVVELIKQNEEFKSMLLEQNNKMLETFSEVCKNGIGNNNTINSHNKAFNLQVFLNEDCKDAMNVTQFIDSFNLQLSDFENVGNLGFVNGISDIIIKKLKSLDVNERPIHCTDQKRQVLYAKVIDKWEKEGDDNKILRRIIKCVAFKNSKNIQLFRDKYPDCMNWDSKHADRYQILRIESLGGLGNEDVDNENKIIRKIAREILIDKSL